MTSIEKTDISEVSSSDGYEIKLDMNVLNHLGMSLYSNTPAVLTEIISNAWDADADEVSIQLKSKGENNVCEVIIEDDGHGMSESDIKNKFLKVGYARRKDNRELSDHKNRQVMGRKGIGKLAMFSLANKIQVTSKSEYSSAISFEIDVEQLIHNIDKGEAYEAKKVDLPFDKDKGTVIKLLDLKKSIDKTESYLRKRLARRFSVIGESHNFKVKVNDTYISTHDRNYLSELQFLWEIGSTDKKRKNACKKLKESEVLDGEIEFQGATYDVRGYIGSVKTPSVLKDDIEISNNTITVMANGRVFDEDILPEFGSAKHFTNYLVGELVIDFLDDNNHPDMATSSRQKLQQNDPRYPVIKEFFKKTLNDISSQWDVWRALHGTKEEEDKNPALKSWLTGLTSREQKAARDVIGKVSTMSFSGSKSEQQESKKTILKNTILGFEKLRVKGNINQLEKISSLNSEAFHSIFTSIDDIESSMFYEITSQRLSVIEKFGKLTDNNQRELERTVQNYLFDHLWLLDPSWERVTGESVIEQTLTNELKSLDPSAESGARVDIAYKTISGKHVIIEMKRPTPASQLPKFERLFEQGEKYIQATQEWYYQHPDSCPGGHGNVPEIEIIFLLGANYDLPQFRFDMYRNRLKAMNGKVMTYGDLIIQSTQAYDEYLQKRKDVKKIQDLIDEL
ncbi:ATP-binding protein [Photobacterium sp. TY1-4]|uniref:BbrUII/HgiDII family restriction enzyme n=1 Tax=Photobacterium sp. TY1-4 TaxID=2899122 RepID=UPI0021C0293D|nr:ATP-binding protein [Photobacterium sp. TY1-4]UXI00460.1 ATP-binding protein [Photobacterium sp. TY1-4]